MNRSILIYGDNTESDSRQVYRLNSLAPIVNVSYDIEQERWCISRIGETVGRVYMGSDYFVMADCVLGSSFFPPNENDINIITSGLPDYMDYTFRVLKSLYVMYKDFDILDRINLDNNLTSLNLSDISDIPLSPSIPFKSIYTDIDVDVDPQLCQMISKAEDPNRVRGSYFTSPAVSHIRYGLNPNSRVISDDCGDLNNTMQDIYELYKPNFNNPIGTTRRVVSSETVRIDSEEFDGNNVESTEVNPLFYGQQGLLELNNIMDDENEIMNGING